MNIFFYLKKFHIDISDKIYVQALGQPCNSYPPLTCTSLHTDLQAKAEGNLTALLHIISGTEVLTPPVAS